MNFIEVSQIKTPIQIAADVLQMGTLFYGNEFDLGLFKAMLKQKKTLAKNFLQVFN